jgi:GH24 family phage-related lysozyme (muramidase)
MHISQRGIALIKQFEGCRLTAYKPVPTEQYWTIGYGHYGADVAPGSAISQAQAEMYLIADVTKYEKAVNALGIPLNQNQFDALVSFAYNCGIGNLKRLCTGRTPSQIAEKMVEYNKGGGKVLTGLVKRRQAEQTLFLTGVVESPNRNPYPEPTKNIKYGSRGNDVRWLQVELGRKGYNLVVDGIAKDKTINALKEFQKESGLVVDGICGVKTREKLR